MAESTSTVAVWASATAGQCLARPQSCYGPTREVPAFADTHSIKHQCNNLYIAFGPAWTALRAARSSCRSTCSQPLCSRPQHLNAQHLCVLRSISRHKITNTTITDRREVADNAVQRWCTIPLRVHNGRAHRATRCAYSLSATENACKLTKQTEHGVSVLANRCRPALGCLQEL